MNFQIIGTGHSFKGAMAYYLHDKRKDGQEAHPTTSDRVAFTETRNMMEVGPHTATRIMIGTAAQADELKREAGIKAGTPTSTRKPPLTCSVTVAAIFRFSAKACCKLAQSFGRTTGTRERR